MKAMFTNINLTPYTKQKSVHTQQRSTNYLIVFLVDKNYKRLRKTLIA